MIYNNEAIRKAQKKKVIGWLVCVGGEEIGSDYRLVSGYNWVGKREDMDIRIEEDSIADHHHCAIVYDEKHNTAFLLPQEEYPVSHNDEIISEPVSISDQDKIGIGQLVFCFVAFCKGERTWKNIAEES